MAKDLIESLPEFRRKIGKGFSPDRISYNIGKMAKRYSAARVLRYIAKYTEFAEVWEAQHFKIRNSLKKLLKDLLATAQSKKAEARFEYPQTLQQEIEALSITDRFMICHVCNKILFIEECPSKAHLLFR